MAFYVDRTTMKAFFILFDMLQLCTSISIQQKKAPECLLGNYPMNGIWKEEIVAEMETTLEFFLFEPT